MRVVDYKTGRSPSELFEGKALFQMKFYALVLWRLRGEIPRLLQLVYLGNGEVVRYTPDEHDLLSLERNLKAVWTAIERAALTGDWRPKTSRLCDWCDFRHLCPAWGGTPPPLPEDAAQLALDPVRLGSGHPGRRLTGPVEQRQQVARLEPLQARHLDGPDGERHRDDVGHRERRHAGRHRRTHAGGRVLDGDAVARPPPRAPWRQPGRARDGACRARPRHR